MMMNVKDKRSVYICSKVIRSVVENCVLIIVRTKYLLEDSQLPNSDPGSQCFDPSAPRRPLQGRVVYKKVIICIVRERTGREGKGSGPDRIGHQESTLQGRSLLG